MRTECRFQARCQPGMGPMLNYAAHRGQERQKLLFGRELKMTAGSDISHLLAWATLTADPGVCEGKIEASVGAVTPTRRQEKSDRTWARKGIS